MPANAAFAIRSVAASTVNTRKKVRTISTISAAPSGKPPGEWSP